jgi:hypothetical protein
MMRILFIASAVATDLSKIKSPMDDVTVESVQEAIADTLTHMSKGDCKKLKQHLAPKMKESLKRMGRVIDDVGKLAADANPMVGPMVSMATSYLTTSGNTVIDTIVNNHACDVLIRSIPEPVRSQLLPKVKDVVKQLGDPEKCEELQKIIKSAAGHVKRTASDLADSVAAQLAEHDKFDKSSMTPFVEMAKEWFVGQVDEKLHEAIDEHLCPLVYGHHDEL